MEDIDKQYAIAILESLEAALSPDKALIDKGQHQLGVLESRPEYSYVLVKILLDVSYSIGIRQLAGVLFKQHVELHWNQNSEKFKAPEIDNAYKLKIKHLLPYGLADVTSKIRTSVAYVIAAIAYWDWPELWPDLLDILIGSLGTQDLNAIDGAIKALTDFIGEVTDMQLPQVAPRVMPQIYNIFINPQHFHIRLRCRTIEIFNSLVNTIAEMSEYDTTAAKKYLHPYLENFVLAMAKSLSMPDDNQTMDCGLRKEIISALTTLVKTFPKRMEPYINDTLSQIWSCLVQNSSIYTCLYANCLKVDQKEMYDSEGEELKFDNLIHQLFEFILCLKDKKRYKPIIKTAIDELCYYSITYMQITEEQVDTWTTSPEQFVEEEDEDSFSCTLRVSGQELLDAIAVEFKKESVASICKAIGKHIEHAHGLKEANNAYWWKYYESCLLAINSFKDTISELSVKNALEFDLNAFINQVVISSLYETNYPFLVGRAIYTASKFAKLLSIDLIQKLVEASACAMETGQNTIMRIFAMKAVFNFCTELDDDETRKPILIPHLPKITDGLIRLITENPTNQIGTISLDTLALALTMDEKFVDNVEGKVVPLTTAMFLKYANDPVLNSIVIDIFKIFINNPYTNGKVEQRLLPTMASILNIQNPANSSLMISSLDILTTFVRSSPSVPLSDHLINLFINVCNLCLKHDDSGLLQSGGECLRAYISKSSEQLISLKSNENTTAVQLIVMVIGHMLDPKTSENSCSFIGKLINTVMKYMSHALGDNLDLILKAVLSKMQSSKVLLVQQSLIVVFAHLIHAKMDNVLTFLTNIPGPTGRPVLEFLLTEWVSKQNSFVGPYECKISILALAKLLEHAVSTGDRRFQDVFVKGDRIINPTKGIKTRSKSKNEEELYTQVPLVVKMYKLLINELHSQIEDSKNDDDYDELDDDLEDEEDEYENCDDEDEDEDDDDCVETDDIECDNGAATIEVDPQNGKYLNHYNLCEDLFEKDEIADEDDPDSLTDPLMAINLLEYLTQYIRTLSQHPFYSAFKQHHNDIEKDVLKEINIVV